MDDLAACIINSTIVLCYWFLVRIIKILNLGTNSNKFITYFLNTDNFLICFIRFLLICFLVWLSFSKDAVFTHNLDLFLGTFYHSQLILFEDDPEIVLVWVSNSKFIYIADWTIFIYSSFVHIDKVFRVLVLIRICYVNVLSVIYELFNTFYFKSIDEGGWDDELVFIA